MSRTKGAGRIPPRSKAKMLAQKNTGLYSNQAIAKTAQVALTTVEHLTDETVSPAVRAMARKMERDFITYAEANALKAQQRTFDMIDHLSADKAAVVAEKNFNMARLWRHQPTSIVQTQQSKIEHYVSLTRKISNELGITVEETFSVVIEDIPTEFIDEVERRLLGTKIIGD